MSVTGVQVIVAYLIVFGAGCRLCGRYHTQRDLRSEWVWLKEDSPPVSMLTLRNNILITPHSPRV